MLENFAPPFIWPIENAQLALDLGPPWRTRLMAEMAVPLSVLFRD